MLDAGALANIAFWGNGEKHMSDRFIQRHTIFSTHSVVCRFSTPVARWKWSAAVDASDQAFFQEFDKSAAALGTFDPRSEPRPTTRRQPQRLRDRCLTRSKNLVGFDGKDYSGSRPIPSRTTFQEGPFRRQSPPPKVRTRACADNHTTSESAWDVGIFHN